MSESTALLVDAEGANSRGGRRVSWQAWIAIIAALVGTICRIAQYVSNQSFCGDESLLVLNVRAKSALQLMGSLTTGAIPPQTAPPVYLWALKFLELHFGESELSYRLPALVMGILALPLLGMLAWRVLEPTAAMIVVVWAAFSDRMVDHSILVKQYSGDLAVAAFLTWLAVRLRYSPAKRLLILSLCSACLVWTSEPVIFVFGGITLALLPEFVRTFKWGKGWLIWVAACAPAAASIAVLFFVSMRTQRNPILYEFWKDYFPDYRHVLTVPVWVLRRTLQLCDYPYVSLGFILLMLVVIGSIHFYRTGQRQILAILLMPAVLTLAAALAHEYPYGGSRVDFFLMPCVFVLAAAGISAIGARLGETRKWQALIAAVPMIGLGAWHCGYHLVVPRCVSHLRPAVEWVQKRYERGDGILLLGGETKWTFYAYWPKPPEETVAVVDLEMNKPPGRFWIITEYAPGEFDLKRKGAIAELARNARPVQSESFFGKGGAAMLFDGNHGD